MTIEIIAKPKRITVEGDGEQRWQCDLWIARNSTTWYLAATASGDLLESELQGYFEAREDWLWGIAQQKQQPPDIFENVGAKRIMKALALVDLDEHNRSRVADGEPVLTKHEWRQMILDKLKGV